MKKIKKNKAFLGAILAGVGMAADAVGKAVAARKESNLKRREYEKEQGQIYENEALANTAAMNQELNDRGYIDAMKNRITFKMGGKYNNRFKSNKIKAKRKKFTTGGESKTNDSNTNNTNTDNTNINELPGTKIAGEVIGGLTSLGSGIASLAMSAKNPINYTIKQGEVIQAQNPKILKAPNDMVQQTNLAMQQAANPQLYTNQVQNPILTQAKLGTKRIRQKNLNRFKFGGEKNKKNLIGDRIMIQHINEAIDSLGIDEVRRRLYKGLSPIGYDSPYKRFKSAMSGKEERRPGDESVNDIWAEYLHIPKEERYKPASRFVIESGDISPNLKNNKINYTLSPFRKHLLADIVRIGEKLNIGETQKSNGIKGHGLQPVEFRNFTIGRGRDNKGDYVSYYDKWDLNPLPSSLKGIITNGEDPFEQTGIATPIDFYDKIYLDDYYNLNEEDKGNPWLPTAVVVAKRKNK